MPELGACSERQRGCIGDVLSGVRFVLRLLSSRQFQKILLDSSAFRVQLLAFPDSPPGCSTYCLNTRAVSSFCCTGGHASDVLLSCLLLRFPDVT